MSALEKQRTNGTEHARNKRKGGGNGNLYCSFSITKLQRSLTSLGVTIISTSADKQGRTSSSSSQFILSGFDVVWRQTLMMCPLTRMILRSVLASSAVIVTSTLPTWLE